MKVKNLEELKKMISPAILEKMGLVETPIEDKLYQSYVQMKNISSKKITLSDFVVFLFENDVLPQIQCNNMSVGRMIKMDVSKLDCIKFNNKRYVIEKKFTSNSNVYQVHPSPQKERFVIAEIVKEKGKG